MTIRTLFCRAARVGTIATMGVIREQVGFASVVDTGVAIVEPRNAGRDSARGFEGRSGNARLRRIG
jgi:hypothetical protein